MREAINTSWLELEGKVIIVTGGASGIGRAVVEELLADGAMVAVCDINPEAPAFENDAGGKTLYLAANVTNRESVEKMVADTLATFGRIDGIVNNAGINIPRLLVDEGAQYELDEAVWNKVMDVNLKGVYLCAQTAGRVMVRQGGGVILNMSSESGLAYTRGITVDGCGRATQKPAPPPWTVPAGCPRRPAQWRPSSATGPAISMASL